MPMKEDLKERIRALEEKIRTLEARNTELEAHGNIDAEPLGSLDDQALLLKILMESSPEGILVVDRNQIVKSYNRRFLEMLGISPGIRPSAAGKKIMDRLNNSDEVFEPAHFLKGCAAGPTRDELELDDGRVMERHTRPIRGPGGENCGRISFFRDITRRKMTDQETENTLRKSEEMYRNLFEYHPLPLLIFDPETLEILKVNDAAVQHYGYGKEEFENLSVRDIRPPEDMEKLYNTIRSIRSIVDNPGIFRHRKKDGSVIFVDIHSHEIFYGERPARLVLCHDVTEQIQAQNALEESEEKFRTAFLTSPDSININRLKDGLYMDINEGFEKIMGYTREDVIGKTSLELDIWVDPEDRAALVKGLTRRGQVHNLEALFRAKDGTIRNGLMSATIIVLGGESYILSITRDISEMKLAEERIRSSLEEKNILLKEIHHRVKNNLQVVSGLLNLQASFIEDREIRERFRESENRVKTIAIMHEDLYESQEFFEINFATYVRRLAENLLSSYADSRRRIELDLDLEDARLVLDTVIPCSLVITELLSNALNHAFDDGQDGLVTISFHPGKTGDFHLQISDNGKGFPENLDFRRTKTMGMQLVCVLVEQLGGTIELCRKNGTTFRIIFNEYQEAGTEMY